MNNMEAVKYLIKAMPFEHKEFFTEGFMTLLDYVEKEVDHILARSNELHLEYIDRCSADLLMEEVFKLDYAGWSDTAQSTLLRNAADLRIKCQQLKFLTVRFKNDLDLMDKAVAEVISKEGKDLEISKFSKTVIATFAAQYSQLQGLCSSIKASAHILDYEISKIKESHKSDQ